MELLAKEAHVTVSSLNTVRVTVFIIISVRLENTHMHMTAAFMAIEECISETCPKVTFYRLVSVAVKKNMQFDVLVLVMIYVKLCVGSKVDSKEITTRNILKYISLIVKNKNFFLIDPDRQKYVCVCVCVYAVLWV